MPILRTAQMVSAIRAGDKIMVVKGSPGSKMKTNALERRFPGNAARDEAAA